MKLIRMEQVRKGTYLNNYELTYLNKSGREKIYEIVSRKALQTPQDIGQEASGLSIVVLKEGRFLLLREFRMSVNKPIYNLCAGMLEQGENPEECIRRELYEETGLSVRRILHILQPAYSAVGFSDTKTYLAFVEAEGELADHTSENEEIKARFYTPEEITQLLATEEFSDRAQMTAYFYSVGRGMFPVL